MAKSKKNGHRIFNCGFRTETHAPKVQRRFHKELQQLGEGFPSSGGKAVWSTRRIK